jgi:hypothetical protein
MDPISIGLSLGSSLLSAIFGKKTTPTPTPKAQGQLSNAGPSATTISQLQAGSSAGFSANFASTTGSGGQASTPNTGVSSASGSTNALGLGNSGISAAGKK